LINFFKGQFLSILLLAKLVNLKKKKKFLLNPKKNKKSNFNKNKIIINQKKSLTQIFEIYNSALLINL